MREIVMDTETTGLSTEEGHRIVEIGGVELLNHVPTGRTFHEYVNPQRDMPKDAYDVHGISEEFLADKPPFAEVGPRFLEFVGSATLVFHNASFDMKFINAELRWANLTTVPMNQVVDTLAIARKKFPGANNSLDALCRRFSVDNSARTKHGALLDSEILAEVYLELIGGRQPDLVLSSHQGKERSPDTATHRPANARPKALPPRLTDDERNAHAEFVKALGPNSVWSSFDAAD